MECVTDIFPQGRCVGIFKRKKKLFIENLWIETDYVWWLVHIFLKVGKYGCSLSGWKSNGSLMISKGVRWCHGECISMFFSICGKELLLCCYWTFCGWNCQKNQSQNIPLIFLKFCPEFPGPFKKLCFRSTKTYPSERHNIWNCKTV